MRGMKRLAIVMALASGAALAGEATFTISCHSIPQSEFDRAVAMIGRPEAAATFQELARRDPDCAILLWGVAMTTREVAQRRSAKMDALLSAAVNTANEAEWQKISDLPDR